MGFTNKRRREGVHRKVVLAFQYSFSYCISSGLRSLPYVLACGVLEGAHMIIMPSTAQFSEWEYNEIEKFRTVTRRSDQFA